jgi:hypothetical protein
MNANNVDWHYEKNGNYSLKCCICGSETRHIQTDDKDRVGFHDMFDTVVFVVQHAQCEDYE